jgi:hypothetical protein
VGLSLVAQSSGEIGSWRWVAARAPGALMAWSPRAVHAQGSTVARLPAARWGRQGVASEFTGTIGRTQAQGGGGKGAPERWVDDEVTQVASGGEVAPVVVDECGEVLQLEGDNRVRRGG